MEKQWCIDGFEHLVGGFGRKLWHLTGVIFGSFLISG
jgi:hypothetical protein